MMRDRIFVLRVLLGMCSVDVFEFAYVVEEKNFTALKRNTSLILIIIFYSLEVIFLVIISIRTFLTQKKIFTVGYVFIFKLLSFLMAAFVFNTTTANFNMGYYKELYYNVTNWEGEFQVSVATVSAMTIGLNFLELIGKTIYIFFIYFTTSKSCKVICCSAAAKSEHEPEDTIQDSVDYI